MKNNDETYRAFFGVIKTEGLLLDFINGVMEIQNNSGTDAKAIAATANKSFEVFKGNKDFNWRTLIDNVVIGEEVTILTNGILADSKLENLIIPPHINTAQAYAICYSMLGKIVFQGDNISFSRADGMFEGIEGFENGEPARIICEKQNLLNSLLVNAEKLMIPEDTLINGKAYKNYTEVELQAAREAYIELPADGPKYNVSWQEYTTPPYFSCESDYSSLNPKLGVIKSDNFTLDTATGILNVTGNALEETEILVACESADINPKEYTTSIKFDSSVTRCPETAFAEYKKLMGVHFPKNVVSMGVNSFASAGDNGEFYIAIENSNFQFITGNRALNSAGITDNYLTTDVHLFFGNGDIDPEILEWLAPRENTTIVVHPYEEFDENLILRNGGIQSESRKNI